MSRSDILACPDCGTTDWVPGTLHDCAAARRIPFAAAIGIINGHLDLAARRTERGDELKCLISDGKAYLDAKACFELAEAFERIAVELRRSP